MFDSDLEIDGLLEHRESSNRPQYIWEFTMWWKRHSKPVEISYSVSKLWFGKKIIKLNITLKSEKIYLQQMCQRPHVLNIQRLYKINAGILKS